MKLNYLMIIVLGLWCISSIAQVPLEPIKKVEVGKNRQFMVNGKPFFPIMSWAQPPKMYPLLRDLNFNTFCGNADESAAKEVGRYAVTAFKAGQAENGYVLGWIYSDEPDLPKGKGAEAVPRQTPDQVAAKCAEIRASEPKRLIFITLTSSFLKEQSSYPNDWRTKNYPQYVKSADVIGFDYYPIYGWGYPTRLNWEGSAVGQLAAMAGKRPLYSWIETNKGSKWMPYKDQPDVLPIHTRNEVWQAIINGATAIGYFTHSWFPDTTSFSPKEAMQKELARINAQITKLAPAILADPYKGKIKMTLGDGLKCQFKATTYNGFTYIFAQNTDLGPGTENGKRYDPIIPVGGKATFTIKGLKIATEIVVIDEDRTIRAENGRFTDDFASLAEHIYRIRNTTSDRSWKP
jgi:hypothetical protein